MKKLLLLFFLLPMLQPGFPQQVNGEITFSDDQFQILKVWGTHEERGYAVGYLFAENISDLFENYLMPQLGDYYQMARVLLQTDTHVRIDSTYIYEAMAMAEGINASGEMSMEVDHLDVILANSFLDLQNFASKDMGLENGCSSLLSWGDATTGTDLDGKSVISRHLDWSDNAALIRNQAMVIHFPSESDEQPWLLIGFTGQMSVLSGISSNGLAVMQHNLSDVYSNAGMNNAYEPIWFSLRKAVEQQDFNDDGAHNTLDLNSVVNENQNGYADAFIITALAPNSDNTNEEIASIIELAPSSPYITTRNIEYEDAIPGMNLYAANNSIARNDAQNYCMRYNAIANNISDGTGIGSAENWDIMLNHSSSCAFGYGGNIQFMQYIPENNYLKLAYHTSSGVQACENTPVVYNTQNLFEIPVAASIKRSINFYVYPNPASNYIHVFIPRHLGHTKCALNDITGKTLMSKTLLPGDNTIPIKNLKPGIYFIRTKASTKKLILK